MKARRIIKLILSVELAAVMALAAFLPSARGAEGMFLYASPDGVAQLKGKDEVIYGTLSAQGAVDSVYVVNCFRVAKSGKLTDYGAYASVANLTDTAPLDRQQDAVTMQANAENFYYRGDLDSSDLPWLFEISYYLDGAKAAPQALAGQDGQLEIRVQTRQNPAVDPVFYENYMLQVSITLGTENCVDIEAPNATLANAGENKVAAFTVLPGTDADLVLTALVRDFAMAGIDITALPFSMNVELPDTTGMMDDFSQLSDAIADLDDGVGELKRGAASLKSGAALLREGSCEIQEGLGLLSGNSGALLGGSAQISSGLAYVAASVGGASGDLDLGDLAQLPAGLTALADGIDEAAQGLTALNSGFTPALTALDAAIQGIPAGGISQEQIAALYGQVDPGDHGALDALAAQYAAAQTVKATYDQVSDAFSAVSPAISQMNGHLATASAGLRDMAGQIGGALSGMDAAGQLEELASGLAQLSGQYGQFHDKLGEYLGGIAALAGQYGQFHSGLSSLEEGVGALSRGVGKLHDGTGELNHETANMPDTVQQEIDSLLDEYTGGSFEPVSFTSPRNRTDLVQFVLKCGGIEQPEEESGETIALGKETLWSRLMALFA